MMPLPLLRVLLMIQIGSLAIIGTKADTKTECTSAMDLAFVVDASGSICDDKGYDACDNWVALRAFIHDIVNDMKIGINDVRVAMVVFESSVWSRWNLTTYSDKQALLNAIDNLRYTGGTTNTIAALDFLSTVFSAERGDRPNVRNHAILITDGKPRNDSYEYPVQMIRDGVKRVIAQNIRLLAVGVTKGIDMVTLKELSSPPHKIDETVFVADGYQTLDKVKKQLEIQNCLNRGV